MEFEICTMKKYQTLLYYKYVPIKEAEEFAWKHRGFCKRLGLVGRILIADEGINGTVSGTVKQCVRYMEHLHENPLFADMQFKIDEADELSFAKMHVRYREEIVTLGADSKKANPTELTGKYLDPKEFSEMLDDEDVVVIDMRNDYEFEMGKFKGAVTLDMHNFRDLPDLVKDLEPYKDKKMLTYCTGGIRCEKATSLLLNEGFKEVYQLEGGIIKYSKETGGKDFEGKCYVFDKRVGVDVNFVNPSVISVCKTCDEKTPRMVNCSNPECNEHFMQCESCGEKMHGACSEECKTHPRRREYKGTGYYMKGDTVK